MDLNKEYRRCYKEWKRQFYKEWKRYFKPRWEPDLEYIKDVLFIVISFFGALAEVGGIVTIVVLTCIYPTPITIFICVWWSLIWAVVAWKSVKAGISTLQEYGWLQR